MSYRGGRRGRNTGSSNSSKSGGIESSGRDRPYRYDSGNRSYRGRRGGDNYSSSSGGAISNTFDDYKRWEGDIKLLTNHFPINLKNISTIHLFNIIYDPQPKFKRIEEELNMNLLNKLREIYQNYIFISDGRNIIFSNYYTKDICDIIIEQNYKIKDQSITIIAKCNYNYQINLTEIYENLDKLQQYKTCVEIILNSSLSNKEKVGNNSVISSVHKRYFDKIYEIWKGHKSGIYFSQTKNIYLNLDLTYSCLMKRGCILNLVEEIIKAQRISVSDIDYLTTIFMGIEVKFQHLNISKKILKFVSLTARTYKFDCQIGEMKYENISVEEYFALKYQIKLKYPNHPLVKIKPDSKNIYVPMELLIIKKAQINLGPDDSMRSELVTIAASIPMVRKQLTDDIISDNFLIQNNQYLKNLGIQVSQQMLQVNGKCLKSPTIQYGYNQIITPKNGRWDDRNSKYYNPSKVQLVIFDLVKCNKCDAFLDKLIELARNHGMIINIINKITSQSLNNIKTLQETIKNYTQYDLLVFIVPDNIHRSKYAFLKSCCEISFGKVSQVIKSKNITTVNASTINNILLKINTKSDGLNYSIDFSTIIPNIINPNNRIMVMGADVTHTMSSKLTDSTSVSIGAIVSSIDSMCLKYTTQCALNKRGMDIFDNMQNIVKNSLERYKKSTGFYPTSIIMFRDGLSDGQMNIAIKTEVQDMRIACKSIMKEQTQPKITFICVQKRHNTRFYHESQMNKDTNIKLPPGLVVNDKEICTTDTYYLLSHTAIKGTAKAAKYKILIDENNYKLDDIIKFSYILCHIYYRCNQSVSIPAPTYFAHLCALRYDHYRYNSTLYNDELINKMKSLNIGYEKSEDYENAVKKYHNELIRNITPKPQLNMKMFYV